MDLICLLYFFEDTNLHNHDKAQTYDPLIPISINIYIQGLRRNNAMSKRSAICPEDKTINLLHPQNK